MIDAARGASAAQITALASTQVQELSTTQIGGLSATQVGAITASAAFVNALESGGASPIPLSELVEVSRISIQIEEALR